jgi:hypothetical protein
MTRLDKRLTRALIGAAESRETMMAPASGCANIEIRMRLPLLDSVDVQKISVRFFEHLPSRGPSLP